MQSVKQLGMALVLIAAGLLGAPSAARAGLTLSMKVGSGPETQVTAVAGGPPVSVGFNSQLLIDFAPFNAVTVSGLATASSPGIAIAELILQNLTLINGVYTTAGAFIPSATANTVTVTLTQDGFTLPGTPGDSMLLSSLPGSGTYSSGSSLMSFESYATDIQGNDFRLTSVATFYLAAGGSATFSASTRASRNAVGTLGTPEPGTLVLALCGVPFGVIALRRRMTAAKSTPRP